MYPANLSFFTIIIALFLMCSTSVLSSPVKLSSSHPSTEFARLGPAPYAELQKRIAAFKAAQKPESLEARQLNNPLCRLTGLTWCERTFPFQFLPSCIHTDIVPSFFADTDFQGECFYGQFAGCLEHQPDSWWRDRISSVRPDDNVTCEFRSMYVYSLLNNFLRRWN